MPEIYVPADAEIPGRDGPLERFWRVCMGRPRPQWRRDGDDPELAQLRQQKAQVRKEIEAKTDPDPSDPYADQREKTQRRRLPNGDVKVVQK